MSKFGLAEYIWLDGAVPTRHMRSKARVVGVKGEAKLEDFPEWSFDGSSTNQAHGHDSDCILKPVNFIPDPVRGEGNYLVMCEVFNPDDTPHESNSRAQLRAVLDAGAAKQEPWCGYEQEYTFFKGRQPLGWPEYGYPGPQGPYYCGVGADEVFGREVVEEHAALCLEAGLMFYGINAEVMPGQWEFQIGYRGDPSETADAIEMADQVWLARWLLCRAAEEFGVIVTFDNKPAKGDWNGAGMHTNFSTKDTRDPKKGKAAIKAATEALSKKHPEHIAVYGAGLAERLTGLHETCDINTFRVGDADRGCSIRIPKPVAIKGYGYFEDRRPGANADPYLVAARLCATVCGVDEKVITFKSWPRRDAKIAIAAE
ncbi:MAG: glutamine synthetase beta-grasp domain-containing protein [Alphaproteobacteria bacterium]|nr:glutamine synthetase beta-grasp domain-containing protein [Alphaproteobacteria bacterium]MCB9974862.1 glutamine synthetase beta-grasp domain-containing protein [Rhodospirillales bacterium]